MNKLFSFAAGLMCGAIVGGVGALLLAPSSGEDLLATAQQHLENVIEEGKKAKAETEARLEAEYTQLTQD